MSVKSLSSGAVLQPERSPARRSPARPACVRRIRPLRPRHGVRAPVASSPSNNARASAGSAAVLKPGRVPLRVSAAERELRDQQQAAPDVAQRVIHAARLHLRRCDRRALASSSRSACATSSPRSMPMSARMPRPMVPTVRSSTVTAAPLTRCMSAINPALPCREVCRLCPVAIARPSP